MLVSTWRGVTYEQLAAKLAEAEVAADPHVLRNKVARWVLGRILRAVLASNRV